MLYWTGKEMKYHFIMMPAAFEFVRVLGEILTLFGAATGVARRCTLDTAPYRFFRYATLVAGFYHVGMTYALSWSWLSFADIGIIERLSKVVALSEFAYEIVFCCTTLLNIIVFPRLIVDNPEVKFLFDCPKLFIQCQTSIRVKAKNSSVIDQEACLL
jgi:hypothetical protein